MFFDKKRDKMRKCEECGSKSEAKFSFCPFCGNNFVDSKKEREDFGLLGKDDFTGLEDSPIQGFGMMDKLINSMMSSMMKNLDRQFKNQMKDFDGFGKPEVKAFPNGVRIKISGPMGGQPKPKKVKKVPQVVTRQLGEKQIKKMSSLPRAEAKTSVKRFGDKVVYELTTPGVSSTEDVFVSKLESGYEIKAIGDKKVYVNSVPINLPLTKYSILKNKLSMEFLSEHQQGE